MKRMLALVQAFVFFSAAAWFWVNDDTVEAWLEQQLIIEEDSDIPLVGLQPAEHWLVVVVDFPGHPAGEAWGTDEAENLLLQAAQPYIEQVSGGASTLSIHVHPTVVRAGNDLAAYGADDASKDTDASGNFLPAALAEEVVLAIKDEVIWDDFDLNADGFVDRLLILHSTKGQEESPGTTNRIWSHFTEFESVLDLPNDKKAGHYTMASLQTGSSGVGTMLHEMLHQMGAVDLYPVHDEGAYQSWKGPGDWDIMASGNWNGGGRWPALPTAASLELINAPRIDALVLEWPEQASKPCIGPTVEFEGMSEGGRAVKIQIAPREFVFIEYRSDSGYDQRLPGHGILVTYQDLSVGNFEQNELNTNPELPWLKVIEADGTNDLINGANQGEQSDVFGHNMSFGADGIHIRTHDGLLVHWTATVKVANESASVVFHADDCSPTFTVDLPDHGATLLANDDLTVEIDGAGDCTAQLVATDGRQVALVMENGEERLRFGTPGMANTLSNIRGSITCGNRTVDVDYTVHVMNRIPTLQPFEGIIEPYETTMLTVPLESMGEGDQSLTVIIDGPLGRVAEAPNAVNLNDEFIVINIVPNGLLTDNMLVHGTVTLMTEQGNSWSLDVELQAVDSEDEWNLLWLQPNIVLALLASLMGLFALLATRTKTPPTPSEGSVATAPQHVVDAWGRELDIEDSGVPFDVQE